MPRIPKPPRPVPTGPPPVQEVSPRLEALEREHPEQVGRIRRITAGWPFEDPRWDDLQAAFDETARIVRQNEADRIRRHADSPNVKPHLLEGEWTGLRMAANLLHQEKV